MLNIPLTILRYGGFDLLHQSKTTTESHVAVFESKRVRCWRHVRVYGRATVLLIVMIAVDVCNMPQVLFGEHFTANLPQRMIGLMFFMSMIQGGLMVLLMLITMVRGATTSFTLFLYPLAQEAMAI